MTRDVHIGDKVGRDTRRTWQWRWNWRDVSIAVALLVLVWGIYVWRGGTEPPPLP